MKLYYELSNPCSRGAHNACRRVWYIGTGEYVCSCDCHYQMEFGHNNLCPKCGKNTMDVVGGQWICFECMVTRKAIIVKAETK